MLRSSRTSAADMLKSSTAIVSVDAAMESLALREKADRRAPASDRPRRSFLGSGGAALAVSVALPVAMFLLSAPSTALAQGACDTTDGGCVIQSNGTNGAPVGKPDWNKRGNDGNAGTASPAPINIDLTDQGPIYGYLQVAPIQLQAIGGSGSDGTSASDGTVQPTCNCRGGNGGEAGASNSISLTMTGETQVVGFVGPDNGPGSGAPAVWAYAQGGSGGGGGLPTEGDTPGLSQPGAAGGSITIIANQDPSQQELWSGATGGIVSIQTGILAQSVGGNGGTGRPHQTYDAKAGIDGATTDANGGAVNGPGGTVQVTVGTAIVAFSNFDGQAPQSSNGAGVWATSSGGNGGGGGTGGDVVGSQGGDGGNGAPGGAVTVTVTSGGSVTTQSGGTTTPAIWAQSFGGIGGAGGNKGDAGSGGNAGTGGNGGTVTVVNDGALVTQSAENSPGILAQSFGGAGLGGGRGGGWGASGGEGGTGGNGGLVSVSGSGSITTGTTNSQGVLAQSIGGGGGSGGDSTGWLAVGGGGNAGGNGGPVSVSMSGAINTSGERSTGIMLQSVGGGGGNGGNASSSAIGPINLVVGGSGAGGGIGSSVAAANSGTVTTSGLHSSGMVMQSIGGGGGNGGAAYAATKSAAGGASVALGGSGGGAGGGGTVGLDPTTGQAVVTNSGRIITSGANSHGVLAQSIGGGGGIGGASAARATTYAVPTEDIPIPTISVSASLGGTGGSGGAGQGVTLQNSGLIATGGGGSIGIAGQSIGGGGGSGGDSSASATAKGGGDSPINISGSVAMGGSGGRGGTGGLVSIANSGMIFTRGEAADTVLAQSIGGGGGNGGTGDASAKSTGDNTNISSTVALGGTGGSGGNAGPVNVTNGGALLSLGDGAVGILAQAVGGGGGRGGGAAGTSNGTFTASVGVGGNGGLAGNTTQANGANAVMISNSGTLVTFGADAPGIVAQSIGGGGGLGGKSASTLGNRTNTSDGGNGSSGNVNAATSALNSAFQAGGEGAVNQYNSVSGLIGVSNQALTGITSTRRLGAVGDDAGDLENLGESGGESGDSSSSTSITVHVNVGGRGGAGGNAGSVLVTNSAGGSIGTVGAMSDGIMAQAIGGGGGRGGAAVSSITSGKVNEGDQQGNVPISVGGRGGSGGSAGNVEVDNAGSVTTIGAQSIGIVAQSIAGGGGIAGTSAAKVQGNNASNTSVLSLPIAIGADGGGGGNSGTVTVNNSGTITTRSHDAIGIVAQSITGGGGIIRTRSSDAADNNGGGAVATGGSYGINLTFGGTCGTVCSTDPSREAQPGTAGAVNVTHTGTITTGSVSASGVRFGSNAYGILAQSIGGGGGLVLGGTPNNSANPYGNGAMTGDAGAVTVTVGNTSGQSGSAGNITTYGQGAVALFAQSIGGGGGLAGDTGLTAQRTGFTSGGNHGGNGGAVTLTVNQTATLTTNAANTPAILAQSIGGGGGRITSSGYGANDGTSNGYGAGNTLNIGVFGQVVANGAASPGIFAESVGQPGPGNTTGGSAVEVLVFPGATVQGGTNYNPNDGYGAGIYLVGGPSAPIPLGPAAANSNYIFNQGTITSLGGTGAGGTAIYGTGGWTNINNQGGTITGSINLGNGGGGGTLLNDQGGTINAGPIMNLGAGTITNNATLTVGGVGRLGTTAMTGNLVQGSTGRLVLDTDHSTGASDRIDVQGSVRLGGTLELRPAAVANRAVTVLTATDGVTLDPGLTSTRTHLFAFDAQQASNSLLIQPRAEFAGQAAGLGANQRAVATHLQELWNGGATMDAGFTALAGVRDNAAYGQALNSLSGQTVGAISASRFASSRDFTNNMLNDCATFEGAGRNQDEASCSWARAFGTTFDQNGTNGALGYKATSWTLQMGGQAQLAPGWFAGGSFAYQTSVFRGDAGSSKVSGDSVLLGGLLRYQAGPWQVSGAIDTGYGWYDSQRTVAVGSFLGTAQGKPDAWHVGAHTRLAYQLPLGGEAGGWYAQPRVDLHLNYVRSGGYTEAGATPFNLAVQSEGSTSFTAVPAVEVGGRLPLSERTVLRPFASAGIELSANGDWAATARLASQPNSRGFRASTPIPDVLGKFTLGAELLTTANWDLRVQYSAEVGDGYTAQTGLARVAYRF